MLSEVDFVLSKLQIRPSVHFLYFESNIYLMKHKVHTISSSIANPQFLSKLVERNLTKERKLPAIKLSLKSIVYNKRSNDSANQLGF